MNTKEFLQRVTDAREKVAEHVLSSIQCRRLLINRDDAKLVGNMCAILGFGPRPAYHEPEKIFIYQWVNRFCHKEKYPEYPKVYDVIVGGEKILEYGPFHSTKETLNHDNVCDILGFGLNTAAHIPRNLQLDFYVLNTDLRVAVYEALILCGAFSFQDLGYKRENRLAQAKEKKVIRVKSTGLFGFCSLSVEDLSSVNNPSHVEYYFDEIVRVLETRVNHVLTQTTAKPYPTRKCWTQKPRGDASTIPACNTILEK